MSVSDLHEFIKLMRYFQIIAVTAFILIVQPLAAQLGFCPGSKGEPIFTENFGNGTTYGPALPAGTTTYPFVVGAPNDGQYTLFYHSAMYSTWHYSLDHTPDATNGPNGKMLLMNANAVTSGDFYKKTVTGLCVNTTFEFSAWLMNVYNPNSNFCGAGEIPINVRFEIWNETETVLLGSGDTGNIMGSSAPTWQQFALVFTTVSETSVVLKMKNNGPGGCGNDLAIDDISFAACGDLTTVSSPAVVGNSFTTCNPSSLELHASTAGPNAYFYQWQTSSDGIFWSDVPGATGPVYITPVINSLTYFRVKAAQDAANLNNLYCSSLSNIFTIDILPSPSAAVSNGDQTICSDQAIPTLSVTVPAGVSVNWYNALSGGSLLQSNSLSFTPSIAGTYYAEAYNVSSNCVAAVRTPVTLTIVNQPSANLSAPAIVCSGETAIVTFNGTPNATVSYTVDSGSVQSITLDASGIATVTTPALTSDTVYSLVSVSLSSCSQSLTNNVTISAGPALYAAISGPSSICSGSSADIFFTGTPNGIVHYTVDGGPIQSVTLNAIGDGAVTTTNITASMIFTLVDIALPGPTGCSVPLSGSLTISIFPIPTASMSVPVSGCANQPATLTFVGTPNAAVTYFYDGLYHSATLNSSGNASVSTPPLTADTTFSLDSVTLNGCTTLLSGSVTVAIDPLPIASFSGTSPACSGDAAVLTFTGTPGATVRFSVVGEPAESVILNATGSASVIIPNVTTTKNYTLIDVTISGTGCVNPLSETLTITALTLPSASISTNPASVCAGQSATVNFTGTPNAVITYSVDGGPNQTLTLGATGTASVSTGPISSSTNFQLISASMGTCSQAVSGSAVITVNPTPSANYSGSVSYCDGDTVSLLLSSPTPGTTFNWTVSQSGTSGATAGTGNQISQTISLLGVNMGTVKYTVTPWFNGCSGAPMDILVTVDPVPIPQIVDGVICTTGSGPTSGQPYLLNTNLSAAGHTFQWWYNGVLIPGAIGNSYNAHQTGVYSVVATNSSGCVSPPVNATVSEMSQGQSLILQQSAMFSDHPWVTVTVVGGSGPFLYQLDDLPFSWSNTFHSIRAGTHTINVTDEYCTSLSTTFNVINYPHFFTPNGDGFNDYWNIDGLPGAVIRIFDRYGKFLKQITSDENGWDGTYNGRAMPSSDYWFTIDYADNGNKTFRAHFSLKR